MPWKKEGTHTPKGHFIVYVGAYRSRYVVPTCFLRHPLFQQLLEISAEEFGFSSQGGIVLPCDEAKFKQLFGSSIHYDINALFSMGSELMTQLTLYKEVGFPDNFIKKLRLSCIWTKSTVLADKPDALLFETSKPPIMRRRGDPLRVYMDLEVSRKRSGVEDIFVSYHANDDVQATYAGALFHNNRNYHVSQNKDNDTLVYWSSSRCLSERNELAKKLLSLLPHHSFGKCLNNIGGLDMAMVLYPECGIHEKTDSHWWDHLHCAMSQYKFVLAIDNTKTESNVTEKLFYALDAGAVPIYFGAPNVRDLVPPSSIIDGSKFSSLEELAEHVRVLANDPVAYAEYHAWRRCGVLGNYARARATSLDTLPCRLCELVSRKGGKIAKSS